MRIVHLANAYAPHSGGVRTLVHALGAGYAARGHELVAVVSGRRTGEDEQAWGRWITMPGLPVPGSGGYRVMVDLPRLWATLSLLRPDRVEVFDRATLRGAGSWARSEGIPAVSLLHERLDGVLQARLGIGAGLARALADRHNATTAARFDHLVTTTRLAREELDRIGVPAEHVPLGVDLAAFLPVDEAGATASGRRPAGGPRLLVCSRLSREKRVDLAIDALRVLRVGGCPATLTVAGDGPQLEGLRRHAAALPVTFAGYVPERADVARLLRSADVVLAPGPTGTSGLAALEAMACGTPVVAAATSAVADLVADGGGRAAAARPGDLAAAVLTVLSDPPEARRRAARASAERYPWERTVEGMLAVHDAPAHHRAPRRARRVRPAHPLAEPA